MHKRITDIEWHFWDGEWILGWYNTARIKRACTLALPGKYGGTIEWATRPVLKYYRIWTILFTEKTDNLLQNFHEICNVANKNLC